MSRHAGVSLAMVFLSGWGLDMCQPWGLAEGKREWAFASPSVVTRKDPHSFPKRHPCTFTQRANLLLYASIWGEGQLPLSPKGWSQCPSSGDPHTGLLRYQRKLRGERYSPSPVCTHTGPSETDLIWPLPSHPSRSLLRLLRSQTWVRTGYWKRRTGRP